MEFCISALKRPGSMKSLERCTSKLLPAPRSTDTTHCFYSYKEPFWASEIYFFAFAMFHSPMVAYLLGTFD